MMYQFDIEYSTHNEYENPVKEGLYDFNIIPFEDDNTRLKNESFSNSLHKQGFRVENNFGFTTYRVRIDKEITFFDFNYKVTVVKHEVNPFDFPLFSAENEMKIYENEGIASTFYFYLKSTEATKLQEHKEYMLKESGQSFFEFLQEVNAHLHKAIKFDPSESSLEKKPDETIAQGTGVCQDFVNLFIAICRENKIPSRYVSGYLHQGVGFQGDAQMHAWVEAYLPGAGWIGFDPTNNLLTDHHFIKVSHGYDYTDTAPIKGVLATSGKNITNYAVQVNMQQ